jgi:hypothetical protein
MNSPIPDQLSDREIKFILNLAHGLQPCRAATEAGFSRPMGRKLLCKGPVEIGVRGLSAHLSRIVAKLDSWKAAA